MKITKEINNKKAAKNGLNPTSQKGITLIALIITIIIMLILVGVTISMAINGGLFDYAGKAVGDMENAIAYEKELSNGRIKIGGVWYDSINDFVQGIISGNQTEDDIIIIGQLMEENGEKYISLQFEISGVACTQKGMLDYVDNNLYVDKTETELEALLEVAYSKTIDEAARSQLKAEAEAQGLTYKQYLKIRLIGDASYIVETNYIYDSICKIANLEVYTEETAVEQQILDIVEYEGTIEEYLISKGTSKAEIQSEAEQIGATYTEVLKAVIVDNEDKFVELSLMDITVSNGSSEDSFVVIPFYANYEITADGTYTFKAEMQDGSGRKGETTIKVGNPVTNPYEDKDWVMAWTWTEGVWSDRIEQGGTAEGDIVVKVYETGETITPDYATFGNTEKTPKEGAAYGMFIEGTGDFLDYHNIVPWAEEALGDESGEFFGFYVTDVSVGVGVASLEKMMFARFYIFE